MKSLTKLLLINWHYFKHQLLELEKINFLTGVNASGKSTIIDALQLLLLGDTSGSFFNKAANEKSRRNLRGYLRGEIAEDEKNGLIYLRNGNFTSYIVGEFWDSSRERFFCMGAVFDSWASGEYQHNFFSLDGALPANHFILEKTPLSLHDLKYWAKQEKLKLEIFTSNQAYREVFRGKMGNLSEKFFYALKKSVPFSPIMDIKGFIGEFVCESQGKMEIEDMLENIRYYRQLEAEQDLVSQKISALMAIEDSFASLSQWQQQIKLARYALARLSWEQALLQVQKTNHKIAALENRLTEIKRELQQNDKAIVGQENLKEKFLADRTASGFWENYVQLKAEKEQLQIQINLREQDQNKMRGFIQRTRLIWQNVLEVERQNPAWTDGTGLQAAVDCLENLGLESEPEVWSELARIMQDFCGFYGSLAHKTQEEALRLQNRIELGQKEIQALEQGIKNYSRPLLSLQSAIREELYKRYQVELQPEIFADLVEVRDEKWRNALEGFLASARFNLLIEPQYFKIALQVYDRLKFQQEFYDLGLVDLARVQQQKNQVLPGSLAEELYACNPLAQVYVNFLLGRVMKCEKAEDLPDFITAITPSAMLYQRFVVRQINPKRYKRPFLGSRAAAEQIRQKKQELVSWQEKLTAATEKLKLYQKLSQLAVWNENDLMNLAEWSAGVMELDSLRERLKLNAARTSELKDLEKIETSLAEIQIRLRELQESKDKLLQEQGRTESRLEIARTELAEKEKQAADQEKCSGFDWEWRQNIGDPWMAQENIDSEWERYYSGRLIKLEKYARLERDQLLQLRGQYNQSYKMGWEIGREDNLPWQKTRQNLEQSSLTAYAQKIKEAREKAQQQFQEDFISKLRENMEMVERQIWELNLALKEISFGRDRYFFRVIPNPQYLKYYRMITSDLLLQGQTVFSEVFQTQYGQEVDELFSQLLAADSGRTDELAYLIDYRTYLDFDLMVLDEQGNQSRLSRILNKKSGGETQTPFYLAVLASFCQIYRVRQAGLNNTLRLICRFTIDVLHKFITQ